MGSLSSCTVTEKSESIYIEANTGTFLASVSSGSLIPVNTQTASEGTHEQIPLISREGLRRNHSHYLG